MIEKEEKAKITPAAIFAILFWSGVSIFGLFYHYY